MDFQNYIMPELLLIVPVLWVFGWIVKEAAFINNKWIPLILGAVGVLLAVCWVYGSVEAFDSTALFTAITQGILCAGAAVYGNQIIKQITKDKDNKGGEDDDK